MGRTAWLVLGSALLLAACKNDVGVTELNAELGVSPPLTDLGSVAVGDSVDFQLQLDSLEGGEINIRAVSVLNVDGTFFSWDGELPVVPDQGTEYLGLNYSPTEEGYHRAVITVTSDTKTSEIDVQVRAHATQARASFWPKVLDFGKVDNGDSKTLQVVLSNDGDMAVELQGATITAAAFAVSDTLPLLVAGQEEETVSITFTADSDNAISGEGTFILDADIDLGKLVVRANDCENGTPSAYDVDEDGWTTCGGDCNDNDEDVHAGAPEVANGEDDDCDGITDEGTDAYDDDGDGYSEVDGDCNDGDDAVSPGTTEDYANGIDDDCDGVVDWGTTDGDADGYAPDGGDCDDAEVTVFPGAPELADGLDNDCDGTTDEGTTAYDDDADGMDEDSGDCDDTDADVYDGAPELGDWIDNDCDGTVDEGTSRYDDDGDGYSEVGGDCNDGNANVSPAELEINGDSIDNDCNGVTS